MYKNQKLNIFCVKWHRNLLKNLLYKFVHGSMVLWNLLTGLAKLVKFKSCLLPCVISIVLSSSLTLSRRFQNLCLNAYLILRQHASLIITLFTMMLQCGAPVSRRHRLHPQDSGRGEIRGQGILHEPVPQRLRRLVDHQGGLDVPQHETQDQGQCYSSSLINYGYDIVFWAKQL